MYNPSQECCQRNPFKWSCQRETLPVDWFKNSLFQKVKPSPGVASKMKSSLGNKTLPMEGFGNDSVPVGGFKFEALPRGHFKLPMMMILKG